MRFATWNIRSKTKVSVEISIQLMQAANIDVLVVLECHTPMKDTIDEWRSEAVQAQHRLASGANGSTRPRRGSMSIRNDANLLRYVLLYKKLGNGDNDRMAIICDKNTVKLNDLDVVTIPGVTRPILHVNVDDLVSGHQWDVACCHAEFSMSEPSQYIINAIKWCEGNNMDILMGDCNLYGPANDIRTFKNVLAENTSQGNAPLDRIYLLTDRGYDRVGRILSNGGTNTKNPLTPVNSGKVVDLVLALNVPMQDAYIQPDHVPIYIDC
jgi:hypothetical protein